ncbi:MAG: hypothetical protein H6618_07775 [Deltaproteobacteria bacterium]|nr:hypothetical protein [Deltaproteobacteria bacterium]
MKKKTAAHIKAEGRDILPQLSAERIRWLTLRHLPSEPEYHLIQEVDRVDQIFEQLRVTLFSASASLTSSRIRESKVSVAGNFFREYGRIDPGRKYFYLKPESERGWLFERSGIGWLVSRSEKIVSEDLFLRTEAPVDIVTTFCLASRDSVLRISSEYFDAELISPLVYERKMIREIFNISDGYREKSSVTDESFKP